MHKCVAIWKYDKRKFNNSAVVYFGMRLLPVDAEPRVRHVPPCVAILLAVRGGCLAPCMSWTKYCAARTPCHPSLAGRCTVRLATLAACPSSLTMSRVAVPSLRCPLRPVSQLQEMVTYTFAVLDALAIKNSCCHSEIKLETRGPVLIEVNCRIHGGEGTWAPMAEAAMGYSAVTAVIDAHLDPGAFAALPTVPCNFAAHAMEAKLRSGVEGTLTAIDEDKMQTIRTLSSYRSEMLSFSVGKSIAKTIDAVTASGNINLVNENLAQLQADYAALHALVEQGLFTAVPEEQHVQLELLRSHTGSRVASPPTPRYEP